MKFQLMLGLIKIAAKPVIKPLYTALNKEKREQVEWLGARFKNIETLGERSVAGLPDNNGAMLEDLPLHSLAEKNDLKKGDVIIKMDNQDINSISDLLQVYENIKWMGPVECIIVRNQSEMKLRVSFK